MFEATEERREMLNEEQMKDFEELWSMYPRKIGKRSSIRAYKMRLAEGVTNEDLKEALQHFILDKKDTEMKFIPHGNRFFIDRYIDYLPENYKADEFVEVETFKYKIKGYDEYLELMMSMDYKDYIQTEQWLHLRNEALIFFGNKCQLCNKEGVINVHHKTYENRGRETFNDVIPLCTDCHKLVHGIE